MEFESNGFKRKEKRHCINTLLESSGSEALKESAKAINAFNLLEGERVKGLRDLSTPEYGYWLTNGSIRSLVDYLGYNRTLYKTNIVEKNFGMENFNNVFEISEYRIKIFKVQGNSLIRIVITKFKDNEYLTNLDIYDNVSGSLQAVLESLKGKNEEAWEYYDEDTKNMVKGVANNLKYIGNLKLYGLNFKTIDTIIKTIKREPDQKISYGYKEAGDMMLISRNPDFGSWPSIRVPNCDLMHMIANDVNADLEDRFEKVKTK